MLESVNKVSSITFRTRGNETEEFRIIETQQQDRSVLLNKIQLLSDREYGRVGGGLALGAMQTQELETLKVECRELKRSLTKLSTTTEKSSDHLIPELQGALQSLEAKVEVLTSQAPTNISWEAVSEKMTSEVERTSGEWVTGKSCFGSRKSYVDSTQCFPSQLPMTTRE